MRLMHSSNQTALLRNEALSEAEEARSRVKTLSRELAEFKEVHTATIHSLTAECNRVKAEASGYKVAVESAQAEAAGCKAAVEAAQAEARAAREEMESFKASEAEKQQAFLKSQEFKEILGPKAFKFLTIGLQSCKDQFLEAGLVSADASVDLPDLNKAIASVPDNVLEDDAEEVIPEIPKEINRGPG